MENALRDYVNNLFPGAATYPHLAKARDAVMEQAVQQYQQLITEGKTAQEAYQAVVAGIGHSPVATNETVTPTQVAWQQYRKKSAWMVTGAVMLYILSIIPPILFGVFLPEMGGLGAVFMFVLVALATGLLVFNHMAKPTAPMGTYAPMENTYAPHAGNQGQPDTLNENQKSIRRAILGVLWSLIVAAYLLISFLTGAWYITWLIFLIGGAVEQVVRAVLDLLQRS